VGKQIIQKLIMTKINNEIIMAKINMSEIIMVKIKVFKIIMAKPTMAKLRIVLN